MLKGEIVLSGLSDYLSAGWFSIDFLTTLEHNVQKMDKPVLARAFHLLTRQAGNKRSRSIQLRFLKRLASYSPRIA